MAEYLPTAGGDNSKLPGIGGVFNPVNIVLFHFAGNNPIWFVNPDGKSAKDVLMLIAKPRDTMKYWAAIYVVDISAIASVIIQEKFKGIGADLKYTTAYIFDGGVNDKTPAIRSYGLAEMQIGLADRLLKIDISKEGG